ncbi:unnamed protein product, partial [Phaeothamnion confervicola]
QGIGQLFPWNAFISATEYFGRRLCGTAYADNFENCFSVGYNLSGLAGLALAVRCQRLLRPRSRVLLPLALTALAFLVCFMLVLAPAVGGDALFLVTMVCIVASALAVAFLQSALFGLAGRFPPLYTQGMMAGQGIAGLVVALSSLLTTMAGPDATCLPHDTVDGSTLAYFGIAFATLVLCAGAFIFLERLPVAIYYLGAAE